MKNKICFFVFTLITLCAQAQLYQNNTATKTIIVYDTITVYDTIFVYDTIKTENKVQNENIFKNNFETEKAYLAIDTNDFTANLLVLNKNDTATISINSIILSENSKNSDTMKKELLTLLVSASLTQAVKSQQTTNNSSENDVAYPNYTISIGATIALNTQSSGKYIYGENVKLNKNINPRNSFGISSDVGYVYDRGETPPNSSNTLYDLSGFYSNFFINHNYYINKNIQKNKYGVYLISALGTVYLQTSQKDSYFVNNDAYGGKTKIVSLNISAQIGLGSEIKFNKGKLFGEIISTPSLIEYRMHNYKSDQEIQIETGPTKQNLTIFNGYTQQIILRFGYKFII
ncbi:MAG: hypothetical protein WBM13_02025 [Bacteroidia bacterium]